MKNAITTTLILFSETVVSPRLLYSPYSTLKASFIASMISEKKPSPFSGFVISFNISVGNSAPPSFIGQDLFSADPDKELLEVLGG